MSAVTLGFDTFLDFANDDEIFLAGTRIGLEHIVMAYEAGASAEEIAWRYPAAALDQVHAAIAFYLSHRAEVQQYLSRIQSPDHATTSRLAHDLRQRLDKRVQMQIENGRIRIIPPAT